MQLVFTFHFLNECLWIHVTNFCHFVFVFIKVKKTLFLLFFSIYWTFLFLDLWFAVFFLTDNCFSSATLLCFYMCFCPQGTPQNQLFVYQWLTYAFIDFFFFFLKIYFRTLVPLFLHWDTAFIWHVPLPLSYPGTK